MSKPANPLRILVILALVVFLALILILLFVPYRTSPAKINPDDIRANLKPARSNGTYPCVLATVKNGVSTPSITQCRSAGMFEGFVDAFSLDLRYGRFILRQTDLELNDVDDVPFTRTYVSNDWVDSNPVHAFGRNSNHPYDIAPMGHRNPYTDQVILFEDGDYIYFPRISKGTGFADAVYLHTDTSSRFYGATTIWNGDGWTLKLADGFEMIFPESYNATSVAQGAPFLLQDGAGNKIQLQRDRQRTLQRILTPHGHFIQLTHDAQARITRAEDDAGHWTIYAYNSDGLLTSAVNSLGQQRHYTYDGFLMTTVTDEAGHTLIRNMYRSGVVVGQQFGDGEIYHYFYDWNSNRTFAYRATVVPPSGDAKVILTMDSVPFDMIAH